MGNFSPPARGPQLSSATVNTGPEAEAAFQSAQSQVAKAKNMSTWEGGMSVDPTYVPFANGTTPSPKAAPKKYTKGSSSKAGKATSVFTGELAMADPTKEATPEAQDSRLVSPKAKYTPEQADNDALMMEQAIRNPPAPAEFSGLQVSSTMSIEYESNQAVQVDMSDEMLRSLSPFVIRVEPPLVYGEQGGFQNKKANTVATDFAVGSGFGTDLTGYDQARKAIAQSNISGFRTGGARVQSIQETVVMNNGKGPNKNPTPTGAKIDASGGGNAGVPAIADLYTAVDQARQLSAIYNTPPLVLLINPTTLAMAYTKIQQYSEKTRQGFVFQAWGEEQPKLSITARCGAFVTGERGVQFASRRDSKAWQNLMNAFHLFRNAGYIHDTVGKSLAHLMIGALSIRYDGWVYYGHMESFNFTQDDEHMHGGVEFSIEFTVSAMVDTGQQTFGVSPMKSPIPSPSDPRYQGIQAQGVNAPNEYALGWDGLTTQGRAVGVGDAFLTTVPSNAVSVFNPNASFRTPLATEVGTRPPPKPGSAFTTPPTATLPGQKAVATANANSIDPFRVRSAT